MTKWLKEALNSTLNWSPVYIITYWVVLPKYSTEPNSLALKMNLSLLLTQICFTFDIIILSNLMDSDAINQVRNVGTSLTPSVSVSPFPSLAVPVNALCIHYLVLPYLSPQPVPQVQPSSFLTCTILRASLFNDPYLFPSTYCPYFTNLNCLLGLKIIWWLSLT